MADVVGHCSSSSSEDRRSHFLVAASGYQGHLNPALALARRLTLANGGSARVTLSVAVSAHARMFPSSSLGQQLVLSPPDVEASDSVVSYVPYTDGFDFGARPRTAADRARRRRMSAASLSAIVRRLAAARRPVTCVVSALMLPAADVALEHGIPLAVFWNQSATALAAYYHYFHGHEHLVATAAAAPPTSEQGAKQGGRVYVSDSFLAKTVPAALDVSFINNFSTNYIHTCYNDPNN